jgi:hypothetical protein
MRYFSNRLLNHRLPKIGWALFCLTLAMSGGCQFAPKEQTFNWPWKKDEPKPLPDRILAVWTDSVLHQPNQPGVRGFGGRVYFYAKEDTDPIDVDGSLAVYVFDADDINVSGQKPLRKFVFTADQFNEHMSKTSIGPSYSVWLPWGEIGGPPRRLSLIARFEGRDGGTTISDPTIKLLPGVPLQEHSDAEMAGPKTNASSPFRLSGYQSRADKQTVSEESDAETKSIRKEDIKTIDLPPSFQRHLRSGSSEASPNGVSENGVSENGLSEKGAAHVTLPSQSRTDAIPIGANSQLTDPATADNNNDQEQGLSPVTTQVYDYRNRSRQGSTTLGAPRNDIRQGRWINSINRD